MIQQKCDNNIDFYVTNSMTRLLLAFLLYIIEVKMLKTYSTIESLDLHKSCPKIVFEYRLVPCVHFATNGGTNESQSRHSEAKCQLQAVRNFWNPTLNTLEVIALSQFPAPYWNSNRSYTITRLRLTRAVTRREISGNSALLDDFTGKLTALTALRVALLLLLKEKGNSVPLSDVRMHFMAQTAHRHTFISSIFRGTPSKGVDGATVLNGSMEKMAFS